MKSIEKPLFPGYVFCRFDPHYRLPILSTPGVIHVVGVGKEPLPVDEIELRALCTTLGAGVPVRSWPFLSVGQKVVIDRGPLAGVRGLVAEFKGGLRVVVSITLLQRSVAAEIDQEWIRPADSPRPTI